MTSSRQINGSSCNSVYNQWQNIFAKTDFEENFLTSQRKNLLTQRIRRILPASMFPRPPQSMLCWLLGRIIQKVAHYVSSAWKYDPEISCFMPGSSILSSTLTVGVGVEIIWHYLIFSSVLVIWQRFMSLIVWKWWNDHITFNKRPMCK